MKKYPKKKTQKINRQEKRKKKRSWIVLGGGGEGRGLRWGIWARGGIGWADELFRLIKIYVFGLNCDGFLDSV